MISCGPEVGFRLPLRRADSIPNCRSLACVSRWPRLPSKPPAPDSFALGGYVTLPQCYPSSIVMDPAVWKRSCSTDHLTYRSMNEPNNSGRPVARSETGFRLSFANWSSWSEARNNHSGCSPRDRSISAWQNIAWVSVVIHCKQITKVPYLHCGLTGTAFLHSSFCPGFRLLVTICPVALVSRGTVFLFFFPLLFNCRLEKYGYGIPCVLWNTDPPPGLQDELSLDRKRGSPEASGDHADRSMDWK